jgi:peroxiredoxin
LNFFKTWLLIPLLFLLAYVAFRWYRSPRFGNGAIAADFTAALATGDSIRLSDYRGKIVLLEFWGSWCPPCRQSSPMLRNLRKRYSQAKFKTAKGFELIIVGIDTDKTRWQTAIVNDGLQTAVNVSDLKRFDDHLALLYGVREIPSSFLIDENGVIIGVNASEIKLDELLKLRIEE